MTNENQFIRQSVYVLALLMTVDLSTAAAQQGRPPTAYGILYDEWKAAVTTLDEVVPELSSAEKRGKKQDMGNASAWMRRVRKRAGVSRLADRGAVGEWRGDSRSGMRRSRDARGHEIRLKDKSLCFMQCFFPYHYQVAP